MKFKCKCLLKKSCKNVFSSSIVSNTNANGGEGKSEICKMK